MIRLVLYQPDIPQNAGTLFRLCACLGIAADVIEPLGFVLSDAKMKRAGMDYLDQLDMTRHASWSAYLEAAKDRRRVLLTTKAVIPYHEFDFQNNDSLILGRESAGVPGTVHEDVDARLRIPMVEGLRSINVALAGAMVLGEALRQTGSFPETKG